MSFYIHIDGKPAGGSHLTDVKRLTGASLRQPSDVRKGEIVRVRTGGSVNLYRVARGGEHGTAASLSITSAKHLEEGLGLFYLAGPMRGLPLCNFPAFLTAGAYLKGLGFKIINPAEHDIESGFDMRKTAEEQNFDITKALGWDFEKILGCDGIILLDGWEKSIGAKAERLVAEMTGKQILRLNAALELFAEEGWKFELKWHQLQPSGPAEIESDRSRP